jgi:hypothetical protein
LTRPAQRDASATVLPVPDTDTWRGLLAELLDDAAALPPAVVPVADAVARHRTHRRAWYADVVGPLLVPASAFPELLAALQPGDDLAVGLVADTGLAGLARARAALLDREDAARLSHVEVTLPVGHDPAAAVRATLDHLDFSVPAAVAVPQGAGWERAVEVLAADGAEQALLRVDGPAPAEVPTEERLAAVLRVCLDHGLAFRLAGGPQRPVRHTAPDGGERHGFLNVLAAVGAGQAGAGTAELAAVLAERRHGPLLDRLAALPPARIRSALISFAASEVSGPVDDLVSVGLLAQEED